MKITRSANSGLERGSTLVISLVLTAIVATVLGSYLVLVSQRSLISARSQSWNSAVAVLEAGIEEAFTHLQFNGNNLTADGWTSSVANGQTVYKKQRDLNANAYFLVTISNAPTAPVIYSAGYVRAPLNKSAYISRVVRVTTIKPAGIFTKAIFAAGTNANVTGITLSGNATIDSFNSALGPYSLATRRTNAAIATNSRTTASKGYAVKVGTGRVYGTVSVGPNGGVNVDPNQGRVGDASWTASGAQPGSISNDMNVYVPTNALPTGKTWAKPLPGAVGGKNYTYVLGDGDYTFGYKTAVNIASGQAILVTGNATLWLQDTFGISGNDPATAGYLQIAPGASLTVYAQGSTVTLSGRGVINDDGLASKFTYIGLPTNTTLTYSGGTDFYGTINAPQAAFTISGQSGKSVNAYGAVICKTYTSSGDSAFHYDEALGNGDGALTIGSWKEL